MAVVVVVVVVLPGSTPRDGRLHKEAALPVYSPKELHTAGMECPGKVMAIPIPLGSHVISSDATILGKTATPMVPPHTLPPKRGGGHR